MYRPKHFDVEDGERAAQIVRAHPFATLVSVAAGLPWVTHCPLTLGEHEGGWLLEGHIAKANPHWRQWAGADAVENGRENGAENQEGTAVLAIFQGPQAYVSPSFYAERNSVPTWNYIAVHLSGRLRPCHDAAGKEAILKRLIDQVEPAYAAQWDSLDAEFQRKLLDAIVGFRVVVERCEATFKLSQNRPRQDKARIHAAFAEGTAAEQALSQWMARLGIGVAEE
jgi:transcriptional regulator